MQKKFKLLQKLAAAGIKDEAQLAAVDLAQVVKLGLGLDEAAMLLEAQQALKAHKLLSWLMA